jgi:hypothetical protein
MEVDWQVGRLGIARRDGQRRWDDAYQFLLRWVMDSRTEIGPMPSQPEEDLDGNRCLRTRLNRSPAASTDH